MSSASAPISSASTVSAISSPAFAPTMPAPSRRLRAVLEEQLGQALVAAHAERAPARGPREHRLLVLDALRCRLALGEAHPRDLGIGVGDRRDRARVERVVRHARDHLGRDLALVHRLVREHRLAHDVADREDVRARWCACCVVDGDEAALVHAARRPRRRRCSSPLGAAADGDAARGRRSRRGGRRRRRPFEA